MSNKQETIADIVTAMLEFADTDSQTIGRDVLRRRIQSFAMRIAVAAKRERSRSGSGADLRRDRRVDWARSGLQGFLTGWQRG